MPEPIDYAKRRREAGERFSDNRTGVVAERDLVLKTTPIARLFDQYFSFTTRELTYACDCLPFIRNQDEAVATQFQGELNSLLTNAQKALNNQVKQSNEHIVNAGLPVDGVKSKNPKTVTCEIWVPLCNKLIDIFASADILAANLTFLYLNEVLDEPSFSQRIADLRRNVVNVLLVITQLKRRAFRLRQKITPDDNSAEQIDAPDNTPPELALEAALTEDSNSAITSV